MCKTTCDRPLIRATLERKRTSVGETMQQDIDTRFRRLEADKFALASVTNVTLNRLQEQLKVSQDGIHTCLSHGALV